MLSRPLNLAIVMILLGLLLVGSGSGSPTPLSSASRALRAKKWYTWNNDIEVTKKWYDWQNVPHALQQKRQLDVDDFIIE